FRWAPSDSEQRHLRPRRRRDFRDRRRFLLRAEEHEQIAADPLLRLAVIAELPFVRVEAAVVAGAEDVAEVLVVDDRLDEERRDVRRVQRWMNAHLGRRVIVGAEADAAAALARDLLAPAHRER